jgi:hypothetical protein
LLAQVFFLRFLCSQRLNNNLAFLASHSCAANHYSAFQGLTSLAITSIGHYSAEDEQNTQSGPLLAQVFFADYIERLNNKDLKAKTTCAGIKNKAFSKIISSQSLLQGTLGSVN